MATLITGGNGQSDNADVFRGGELRRMDAPEGMGQVVHCNSAAVAFRDALLKS